MIEFEKKIFKFYNSNYGIIGPELFLHANKLPIYLYPDPLEHIEHYVGEEYDNHFKYEDITIVMISTVLAQDGMRIKPDTSNIIISDKHKTGVAGIHVDRNTGKNSITVVRGAPSSLTINEIDTDLITRSKIFLTQLEVPLDVTLHCLKIAKKQGLINILNPAPACELSGDFFELVDYFTPNETEAEFYTSIKISDENDAKKSANELIKMGIKNVIITLGEKGVFYSNGKDEIYIKARKVKAIDTTGAGDAFNGGFSLALLKGKKIKDCLELANTVAGLSTTKLGAGDSMPTLNEIDMKI